MRKQKNSETEPNTGRIEPKLNTSEAHYNVLFNSPTAAETTLHPPHDRKAVGLLSILTVILICTVGVLTWWSYERIQLLEQQLIATQESFAKVNEIAIQQISTITGQVNTNENHLLSDIKNLQKRLAQLDSTVNHEIKALQNHLRLLEAQLTTLNSTVTQALEHNTSLLSQVSEQKKLLTGLTLAHQTDQKKSMQIQSQLETQWKKQSEVLTQQQDKFGQLTKRLQTQQNQLAQLSELNKRFNHFTKKLGTLEQNINQDTAIQDDGIARLQQDILILRTELDNRPISSTTSQTVPSLADFDAYRAQTNRTISTLQQQVRNLQKSMQ